MAIGSGISVRTICSASVKACPAESPRLMRSSASGSNCRNLLSRFLRLLHDVEKRQCRRDDAEECRQQIGGADHDHRQKREHAGRQ